MLTLTIEMTTAWHVGIGEGSPTTDALTYRVGNRPAIPPTQLKDVIRDHATAIAGTLGYAPDAVDQVFGRPGSAWPTGEWEWGSAVPDRPTDTAVSRHHRRDPDSGVVPRDGLFDLEVAPPSTLVAVAGPRDGVPAVEAHVVLVGIAAATVRRLGARRSRGLGHCRIIPSWEGPLDADGAGRRLDLEGLVGRCPGLGTGAR